MTFVVPDPITGAPYSLKNRAAPSDMQREDELAAELESLCASSKTRDSLHLSSYYLHYMDAFGHPTDFDFLGHALFLLHHATTTLRYT